MNEQPETFYAPQSRFHPPQEAEDDLWDGRTVNAPDGNL
jgi:hypothetical protein